MRTQSAVHAILHPRAFFWSGILLIVSSGRYRPLWKKVLDPVGLLGGLVAGVLAYYGTAVLVYRAPIKARTYVEAIRVALGEERPPARRMAVLGARAIYEEALWRGTVQELLGNGKLAVFLTSLLFTARHWYLARWCQPHAARHSNHLFLELFGFSLLLGSLYRLSGRLSLVAAMHYVRNVLISARCSFLQPGGTMPGARKVQISIDQGAVEEG